MLPLTQSGVRGFGQVFCEPCLSLGVEYKTVYVASDQESSICGWDRWDECSILMRAEQGFFDPDIISETFPGFAEGFRLQFGWTQNEQQLSLSEYIPAQVTVLDDT